MAARSAQINRALDLMSAPADALSLQSLDPSLDAAISNARGWVNAPSVVGFGVGRKDPGRPSELALKVYVDQKVPLSKLPPADRVPGSVYLPTITPSALITDVEEIGRPVLQASTGRSRPLVPGASVGRRRDLGVGTIGCFVAANANPHVPMILSNSHVLAGSGLARRGSTICQPGVSDGGADADIVANLTDYVEFDFDAGFANYCDAAVASVRSTTTVDASIPGIGVPTYDATATLRIGSIVQITGRTSGHAVGKVKDHHYRTRMSYPTKGGSDASVGYSEQVLCTRYSEPGDSGSLVCDSKSRAAGLHWAGSDLVSIFSPISYVFSALDISLWGPA